MRQRGRPKISVVMVDGSFRERFHAVDSIGTQTMPADEYELLWVEYYDQTRPELLDKVSMYPNARIITLGRDGPYHSSYCFNAGICASRGELLVVPDADILVDDDFLERVWDDHETCDRLVTYIYRYNEREKDHSPVIDIEHLREVCKLTNPSNHGGCLSVRKRWLIEINGYDQHPLFGSGFHAGGLDIYTRMKSLGLHVKWHPTLRLYHPWHPGTLAYSLSQRIQKVVIGYRARHLMTKPFQGIESCLDTPIPEDLWGAIEREKKRLQDASGDGVSRVLVPLRRARAALRRLAG